MKVFTEISLSPAHSGFGMYQPGELQISPQTSWAIESDLLFEIANNSDKILPLADALEDEEFQQAEIEDISGRIHNQPEKIFARLYDGNMCYFGIVESEVAEDFYA